VTELLSAPLDFWRRGVKAHPTRRAYAFLNERGEEESSLTYEEVDTRARVLATKLLAVTEPGERALLVFPPGLDFIVAFFACLYSQVIAVPLSPPRRKSLDSTRAIAMDCGAKLVLTTTSMQETLQARLERAQELRTLTWLRVDEVTGEATTSWQPTSPPPEALSFLQYTSGSTSLPKGVMVSHGNLIANQRMIQAAFEHTEESTVVGWAPLHHDQGLIGNVLQPFFVGAQCILMAPVTFLKRPLLWMKAISDYRAQTSGGPNFAFELSIRAARPDRMAGVDLSSWTLAFNGAEPIRPETVRRFIETFAPYGFRPEAMYACYGLAEGTLLVTGGAKSAKPVFKSVSRSALRSGRIAEVQPGTEDARELIGCGHPWLDERVLIVHPEEKRPCAPLVEGEIWVSGPNVALGYWGDAAKTEAQLKARLAGSGDGPFLRTGDLGFFDASGELYVTGRIKDMLIVSGRNHYPHDIEKTVESSHPALTPGSGAAFSVGELGEEEKLVVVQEVERVHRRGLDVDEVVGTIRKAVADEHDVTVHTVVLVRPGSVPKTTSGKVQRALTRRLFLENKLEVWNPQRASADSEDDAS
jgi:acyl-CoA synthetase (AMP-forming)/AMP-acid ligase II